MFQFDQQQIVSLQYFSQRGAGLRRRRFGRELGGYSTYQPLTADASANEIVEHLFLMRGPLKACSICPETTVVVEAQQIERVQRILRTSEDSQ